MTSPFKAFPDYRCECYRAIVIYTCYLGILGHRDYSGLLETCRYYRLGQGEVENVSEDTCKRMLGVLIIRLALRPCEC